MQIKGQELISGIWFGFGSDLTEAVLYMLQKKQITNELDHIKKSGRPQKTTKMDDCRILYMVKT